MGWGYALADAIEYSTKARIYRSYEEAAPIGHISTKCFIFTMWSVGCPARQSLLAPAQPTR
eukprot:5827162-Amphidinium_carterae.1